MRKAIIIIGIIFAAITANAQIETFTSHFEDGSYTTMTIIGNDAYFSSGNVYSSNINNIKTESAHERYLKKYNKLFTDAKTRIDYDTVEVTSIFEWTTRDKQFDTVVTVHNGYTMTEYIENVAETHHVSETYYVGRGLLFNAAPLEEGVTYSFKFDGSSKCTPALVKFENGKLHVTLGEGGSEVYRYKDGKHGGILERMIINDISYSTTTMSGMITLVIEEPVKTGRYEYEK